MANPVSAPAISKTKVGSFKAIFPPLVINLTDLKARGFPNLYKTPEFTTNKALRGFWKRLIHLEKWLQLTPETKIQPAEVGGPFNPVGRKNGCISCPIEERRKEGLMMTN